MNLTEQYLSPDSYNFGAVKLTFAALCFVVNGGKVL